MLNWTEQSKEIPFHLDEPCEVVDFWTDDKLGTLRGNIKLPALEPHSTRLLVCLPK